MDFKDLDKNMLETIIRKVVEQELGKMEILLKNIWIKAVSVW